MREITSVSGGIMSEILFPVRDRPGRELLARRRRSAHEGADGQRRSVSPGAVKTRWPATQSGLAARVYRSVMRRTGRTLLLLLLRVAAI